MWSALKECGIEENLSLVCFYRLDDADLYSNKNQVREHQEMRSAGRKKFPSTLQSVFHNQRVAVCLPRLTSWHRRTHAGSLELIIRAKIDHHVAISQVSRLRGRLTGHHIGQIDPAPATHILKETLMDEISMIAVHAILDLKLPVRLIAIFVDSGGNVQFAFWREVDKQIDLLFSPWAQMFLQCDPGRTQAAEYKSAINGHTRHLAQPILLLAKRRVIAVWVGHAGQFASIAKGPTVISATKDL